jgi:hypothetical protein
MQWIVGGEVEAAALLALQGPAGDEVAHVNHVAQFADVACGSDALEETLRLLVEHVQAVPRTMQTQVTVSWMQRYENIATSATVKVRKDKNFPAQLVKYVNTKDCKVAILNAFPYSAA